MEVQLINEELFKEYSPIKEDTIITKFIPYVNIVQKMYIEKILGRPLTEELKDQIKTASEEGAAGDEITPDNQALLLMTAPPLAFYTVYQGLPFQWASIVNKGITIRESENSKGVAIDDLAQLRRWLKDDAEELARQLIEYLCRCKDKYPLWQPSRGCGCSDSELNGGLEVGPFDAGIFIPKR